MITQSLTLCRRCVKTPMVAPGDVCATCAQALLAERDAARAELDVCAREGADLGRRVKALEAELWATKADRESAFQQHNEMLRTATQRADDNFNALMGYRADRDVLRAERDAALAQFSTEVESHAETALSWLERHQAALAEVERVKAIGQGFERDMRKHFEQSCANLGRATAAESERDEALEDVRKVSDLHDAALSAVATLREALAAQGVANAGVGTTGRAAGWCIGRCPVRAHAPECEQARAALAATEVAAREHDERVRQEVATYLRPLAEAVMEQHDEETTGSVALDNLLNSVMALPRTIRTLIPPITVIVRGPNVEVHAAGSNPSAATPPTKETPK